MNQLDSRWDRGWLFAAVLSTAMFVFFMVIILGVSGIRIPTKGARFVGYVISVESIKGSIFNQYQAINKVEIRSLDRSRKDFCVVSSDDLTFLINAGKDEADVEILYRTPLWLAPWKCRGAGFLVGAEETASTSEIE